MILTMLGGRQVGRSFGHADGSYALDAPGIGSYILIASADGYEPRAATLVVEGEPLSYDIVLGSSSGLVGMVHSAEHRAPDFAAAVIVTDARGEVVASEQTDALGVFNVPGLVPGTATPAVTAPGYRPYAEPVEIELAHH
ncbi:hypothetical protein TN53_22150 [Streptomyces sp. WM6386]|nr:hypothetical protein TN53_22150 [Streptomyces sp. WM6386]